MGTTTRPAATPPPPARRARSVARVVEPQAAWVVSLALLAGGVACGPAEKSADTAVQAPYPSSTDASTPNLAPIAPVLTILPANPTTTDDLRAHIVDEATDPDGDPLRLRLSWWRNGVLQDIDAQTVPADLTERDDVWELRATADDGQLRSPEALAIAVVVNSPPSITVHIDPEAPDTSATLTAQATASDIDGDELGIVYRWWRDGEETTWTDRSIPASETRRGEHWEVGVRALDGRDSGPEVVEGVTVYNAAPRVREVDVGPEGATVLTPLTARVVVDDLDEDTLLMDIRWIVDGTEVQRGTDLTLLQDTPPRDASVVVAVTADDGTQLSNTMQSTPLVIANSPPAYSGAVLVPAAPRISDTVQCVPSGWSDADGDPPAEAFDWDVDGAAVAGMDVLDLSALSLEGGEVLRCRVVPEDPHTHGAPVEVSTTVLP